MLNSLMLALTDGSAESGEKQERKADDESVKYRKDHKHFFQQNPSRKNWKICYETISFEKISLSYLSDCKKDPKEDDVEYVTMLL